MKNKKLTLTIIGGVFLFLAAIGISYAAFRFLGGPLSGEGVTPLPGVGSGFKVDLSKPKTEECPINGGMFTKDEKKIWEDRRPLAVMVENHLDSRPQSGLSRTDIVYEAVAEGGITRFLAIYYCDAVKEDVQIAPVRSARIYFINWVQEYGDQPIYVHVGGANNFSGSGETIQSALALEVLSELGWRYSGGNDLDPSFDGQFPVFWRDYERLDHPVATEHTMMSSTERIWQEAHKRDFDAKDEDGDRWDEDFQSWKFKKEASLDDRGDVNEIDLEFWSSQTDYSVKWQYDREANKYLRFNGGQPHKDLNNDEQLEAKVIAVQFAKERGPIDANKHMLYTIIGRGQAIVFQDGEVIKGTWKKADEESRTQFFDSRGKELALNGGRIWIEVIPVGSEVSY